METIFHRHNFFKYTYCVFKEVEPAEVPFPLDDYNYKSKSGSLYFYNEEGVYRISNHWGRAANCRWRLQALTGMPANRTKIGFARWQDFYSDNEREKLYFITVIGQEVLFRHKNEQPHENRILRTAGDTASVIRKIKKLLEGNKYLSEEEVKEKIDKLVFQ